MNCIILGGNGYLGSKIVKRLLSEGHKIICTKRNNSNLERLVDIIDDIQLIPASTDAIEVVSDFMSIDWIINSASNYGRNNVLYDNVLEANIEFPLSVLNVAAERDIKNFMTIGTGLPDCFNMYSFSKTVFSDFGRFYAKEHNINFFELELQMFYGADEPSSRFLPSIIYDMLDGKDVSTTIGTQKRDIVYIDDIVDASIAVINSKLIGYNKIPVGTGIAPSISEIVDFIRDETGRRSVVHKGAVPMRKNEPDCVADVSLLKSICNWHPIGWQEGLRNMINRISEERLK